TQPSGWTTPSNQQQITATVTAPNISVGSPTVGKDLQTGVNGTAILGAPAPVGGITLTITVADPTKAVLSTSATVAGGPSLTFNIAAGSNSVPTYYVQALTDTGTVQYTASAPGYNSDTGTITLTPSGFIINTPSNFSTTVGAANTTLVIQPARLDPFFLNYQGAQQLRPGIGPVNVNVISSNPAVGTIMISPVVFNGADFPNTRDTAFDPVAVGSSVISVQGPAGFQIASNNNHITATVNP
ncbi:MAG: hypothetical protein IT173_06580, partial [Acidobacteria bacterium]|nr:hypothetical protein [Acidobacteriota bacterium]